MFNPDPVFIHLGSRIQQQLKRGWKKFVSVAKFHKILNYFIIFEQVVKNIWANWLRITVLFIQKIVTKHSEIWDPGSGKTLSQIQGKKTPDPRSGSATLSTPSAQFKHWSFNIEKIGHFFRREQKKEEIILANEGRIHMCGRIYPPPTDYEWVRGSIPSTFVGKNIPVPTAVLRIWDVHPGARIRNFPSRIRIRTKELSIFNLTQKIETKLSEVWFGILILDPRSNFFPYWIQGSKKHRIPEPQHRCTVPTSGWMQRFFLELSARPTTLTSSFTSVWNKEAASCKRTQNITVHRFESLPGTTWSCLWTEPQPVLWIGRSR